MNELNIIVEIKSVYGTTKIYPVCDTSKLLASIAGTKTLTDDTISKIKQLGYQINIKPQQL